MDIDEVLAKEGNFDAKIFKFYSFQDLQHLPYFFKIINASTVTELCFFYVEKHGVALQYVPETIKTPELCLAAIKQKGYAFLYVPEALKTSEFYLALYKIFSLPLNV